MGSTCEAHCFYLHLQRARHGSGPGPDGPRRVRALCQGHTELYSSALRCVLLFREITIGPSPQIAAHKGYRARPIHCCRLLRFPSHHAGTKGTNNVVLASRPTGRSPPALRRNRSATDSVASLRATLFNERTRPGRSLPGQAQAEPTAGRGGACSARGGAARGGCLSNSCRASGLQTVPRARAAAPLSPGSGGTAGGRPRSPPPSAPASGCRPGRRLRHR